MANRKRGAGSGGKKGRQQGQTERADHLASVVNPKLMVSVAEARDMLGGISQKSIYRLINGGELESRKVGARRLIPVWALERYVGLPVSA